MGFSKLVQVMIKNAGFLPIAFIVIIFAACSPKPHREAYWLDKTIEKINDSMFAKERQWSKLMAYAVSSGNYSQLKPVRKELAAQIETGLKKVNELQDIDGSDTYKACELELLKNEKKMVASDFTPFEKLNVNTAMGKVSKLIDKIKEDGVLEKQLADKMQDLKGNFEERIGFKFVKQKQADTTNNN